ncbi:hypothetical protein Acr_15g0013050 [Actinidia rufa]|uniref:Uncharacterized protein n=1 Tax=Actinidia rufa TaxID=165716 RepID=A0A7J0FW84_9ERIC|nr:hypothetical protein Acr_15g0013050 [Actinidia rufa]
MAGNKAAMAVAKLLFVVGAAAAVVQAQEGKGSENCTSECHFSFMRMQERMRPSLQKSLLGRGER